MCGAREFSPTDAGQWSSGPAPAGREFRGPGSQKGAGVSVCTRQPASVPATHPPPAGRADPTLRTRGLASPAGASRTRPRERALEGRRRSGVFTAFLHFLSSAFPPLGVGAGI